MATTGELLVQMSTLNSGTALQHFTNISFGGEPGDCPECPDVPTNPGECEECKEYVQKIIVLESDPKPMPAPVIHTGDILVVEDMRINMEVLDNQLSFGIDANNEVNLVVDIKPNTLKIDLEWL